MPNSIRPGDVLADRYRLVDLLDESGGGRFWRAHDRVLDRHVAVHVIAADDERAAGLLEAARRSATVHDRRLLRVLDADRVDGLCYVVNEWGSGSSLDIMLADEGPLAPRRAAWIVSRGGRLDRRRPTRPGSPTAGWSPRTSWSTAPGRSGSSASASTRRCTDCPPGRVSTDVTDLGGLLYCRADRPLARGLAAPRSPAPARARPGAAPAPGARRHPPPARRAVRPGGQPARRAPARRDGHDLSTARGIADYLRDFVGDPTGLAEAEAGQQRRPARGPPSCPGPTAGRTAAPPRTPAPPVPPPRRR